MSVFETVRNRRSIRLYENKAVEEEKLLKVLEAARLAPSAGNGQPWSFVVITDDNVKKNLRPAYDRDWFVAAPAIIVACALSEKAWIRQDGEQYWKVDVSIAIQNMILVAQEEGLGTCWVAAFDEKRVKNVLGIPRNVRVVAMIPLGYPAEQKGPVVDRKPLEEIIRYEHW